MAGVNSEWIRHGFQNRTAHNLIQDQREFPMMSADWKPVSGSSMGLLASTELSNISKFTAWGQ